MHRKVKKEATCKANRMSSLINELISKYGVVVDNDQHEVFSQIMRKSSCDFEEDSPVVTLATAKKTVTKKDSRSMR